MKNLQLKDVAKNYEKKDLCKNLTESANYAKNKDKNRFLVFLQLINVSYKRRFVCPQC